MPGQQILAAPILRHQDCFASAWRRSQFADQQVLTRGNCERRVVLEVTKVTYSCRLLEGKAELVGFFWSNNTFSLKHRHPWEFHCNCYIKAT